MNKFYKIIKILCYFENPWIVIRFYRGDFQKGEPLLIRPRNGQPFMVSRWSDRWMTDKIIAGGQIITDNKYIIEDNVYLRQGTSDTFIYKEIFVDKCYQNYTAGLDGNSLVIDIGAHIGLFDLYINSKCRQIFAYEAQPDNFFLAQKNIASYGAGNISLFQKAVWSSSGQKVFLGVEQAGQTGEYAIFPDERTAEDGFAAETISLADIFVTNKIIACDLLKVDIEGAEYEVLMKAPDNIFDKIGRICLEYHPDLTGRQTVASLKDFLIDRGFQTEIKKINGLTGLLYAKKQ